MFICALAKKYENSLHIIATDICPECLTCFGKQVDTLHLEDYITIKCENIYVTTHLPSDVDILYTSAELDPIFSYKMLYLAVTCPSIQYLLCNHQHCNHFFEVGHLKPWVRNRMTIVDAVIDNDGTTDREDRWIYALDLKRCVFIIKITYITLLFDNNTQ